MKLCTRILFVLMVFFIRLLYAQMEPPDQTQVVGDSTLIKLFKQKTPEAEFKLMVIPDGADIFLNGQLAGRSPLNPIMLKKGSYECLIANKYCPDTSFFFIIDKGRGFSTTIALQSRYPCVFIKTVPDTVCVFLGEKLFGKIEKGIFNCRLAAGTYLLRFEAVDYTPLNRHVVVHGREDQAVNVILRKKTGKLIVTSIPDNAYVFVDGIFRGRTPCETADIYPGNHDLVVQLDRYSEYRKSFPVLPSIETAREVILRKNKVQRYPYPLGVIQPRFGDKDGDGLKNSMDQCPDDPEDIDGFKNSDGCPDMDNDKDNIADILDKCPDVPEDIDGFEDSDGCPDLDNDKEGIPDSVDDCPSEPEDIDGFEDSDGCPDFDNDKDGIPDSADICRNEPEDKDGFEDSDGCQDLDNDKDGIKDYLDECPNALEVFNDFEDDDGCPDKKVEPLPFEILLDVPWNRDNLGVDSSLTPALDSIIVKMLYHLESRIKIDVHTDSRGKRRLQIEDSKVKAEAIRRYFVSRGVAWQRLTVEGFGARQPKTAGDTEDSHHINQRIELFRIQ